MAGKGFLDHLEDVNHNANPEIMRLVHATFSFSSFFIYFWYKNSINSIPCSLSLTLKKAG